MKPRLTSEDGTVLFEFESDALMCSLLKALLNQAKFGDELRATITLHPGLNDLMTAILDLDRRRFAESLAGRRGMSYEMPFGVASWSPPPAWADKVLQLLSQEAGNLGWHDLDDAGKAQVVVNTFFPHTLPEKAIVSYVNIVDRSLEANSNSAT